MAVFLLADRMDIHIVIKGCEEVEWTPAQHVIQSREYVAERDVEFFTDERVGCRVLVEEGFFCLVMPEDAHKPALAPNDEQRKGRKIVVKVEVMYFIIMRSIKSSKSFDMVLRLN